jgi:hypothetical protein
VVMGPRLRGDDIGWVRGLGMGAVPMPGVSEKNSRGERALLIKSHSNLGMASRAKKPDKKPDKNPP